ncbi:glycosyltransferase family 25 protein [Providencia manganoxydans]|uniref:glycosyltransferase family 25 protein n=1 Tax=Providencia manganoxydans TaxID=2923283 RepID=UPI0034E55323
MKSIVISIKNNNELRRNHIENEFQKSNVSFEFFDAIIPEQIASSESETGIDLSHSSLSLGAKGCLLSHIKIWQIAIKNNDEYIAVFEDDIYLSSSSSIYLSNSDWIPPNIDLIKMEKCSKYIPRVGCKKIKTLDNRMLYELKKINLGTAGYIISIKAAKKILDRLSKKTNILAIDVEMFSPELNNNINCFILEPAICIQDVVYNNCKKTLFPGTIKDDNAPSKKNTYTKKNKSLLVKFKREASRLLPLHIMKKHIFSKRSTYK